MSAPARPGAPSTLRAATPATGPRSTRLPSPTPGASPGRSAAGEVPRWANSTTTSPWGPTPTGSPLSDRTTTAAGGPCASGIGPSSTRATLVTTPTRGPHRSRCLTGPRLSWRGCTWVKPLLSPTRTRWLARANEMTRLSNSRRRCSSSSTGSSRGWTRATTWPKTPRESTCTRPFRRPCNGGAIPRPRPSPSTGAPGRCPDRGGGWSAAWARPLAAAPTHGCSRQLPCFFLEIRQCCGRVSKIVHHFAPASALRPHRKEKRLTCHGT
mmetsp:Transcript_37121/g.91351  ORF Transcript_37121/g.91351 Transcript_37121/m.91351 type:complete len:268 (+) Transcript_37121:895-1698(+)